jgi:hypothetical protein
VGRKLPIYGGKDSRVEIWAIKAVNLVLEAIDLLRAAASPVGRILGSRIAPMAEAEETHTLPFHRHAQVEARFIARLAAAESAEVSEAEITWAEWQGRQAERRAA